MSTEEYYFNWMKANIAALGSQGASPAAKGTTPPATEKRIQQRRKAR